MFLAFIGLCFFSRVSSHSFFSRDISFDSTDIVHSIISDNQSLALSSCARLCHDNKGCRSFSHNQHGGKCRLHDKLFFTRQSDVMVTKQGNVMFTKFEDNGVCELPIIEKGRLLSADGVSEESNATFICNDFYFPKVSHIQCSLNGTWAGLFNACIYMESPFSFFTRGRVVEGGCVVVIALPQSVNDWASVSLRPLTSSDKMLYLSFRFGTNRLFANDYVKDTWGHDTRVPLNYPIDGQYGNLTLCTLADAFTFYIDGEEKFYFEHRLPFEDVEQMVFTNFRLKRIVFM